MITNKILENRSVMLMICALYLQSCTDDKKPSGDVAQPSEKNVVDVLAMPEESIFNAYEHRSAGARENDLNRKYQAFFLKEDAKYSGIYLDRKRSPGFVGIEKAIRSDSAFLVKEFNSSMLLLAAPTPFNAFYKDFVAVGFWGAGHGVLYSSFLNDSVVKRDSLSMDALDLITSVMRMHPPSQEDIGSDGGYLVFVSSIMNGSPQSFIVRRTFPYQLMSKEDFPQISDERFTMLSVTDSMIWTVAKVVEPGLRLQ